MKRSRMHGARWGVAIFTTLVVLILLGRGGAPPQDLDATLDRVTAGQTFDFASWEMEALARKTVYYLLSPQRFMSDEEQSRFVLAYLDDIREAQRLSREIDRIYTDPDIADPEVASQAQRDAWEGLRAKMAKTAPIAEAILESQVSHVLAEGGLSAFFSVLPPVRGSFTPLPQILVVSPRDRIESVYQQQLEAGLTAAEQTAIEEQAMRMAPDYSAYVTKIGGLAAYPAMLLEVASIDWVTDVVAHEWTHHYLAFYPLGWYYMRNGETRTINETTASLVGEWAGQEVLLRYYEPLLASNKGLPNPLRMEPDGGEERPPDFDFRAEMHKTRVVVDQLLKEGKISEAESYMERRREFFVENGYQIRRLNQAYFAFHGAYASAPGAAGEDPIGPLVRRTWATSATPAAFLREIASITTLQELRTLTQQLEPGT